MTARTAREIFATHPWSRLRTHTLDYYQVGIGLALALGIVVRAAQVLGAGFPLNDGGLFYQMVRDLQANDYLLPANTSYNAGDIPYAYSPLAFYIAGILDDVTPFSLLTLFRLLPLLFTCLTLWAFWRLARTMLGSKVAIVAALAAFALIPRSFIWLIMGGGITRSLGLLFAILALEQVYKLYQSPARRPLLLAMLFAAATVLSHLQTGWFLAYSIVVFWIFLGMNKEGIRHSLLLAGGTMVLTSPWWLTIVAHHGIDPFLAANGTGGSVFSNDATRTSSLLSIARAISTSEPFFPVIASLGLLGAVLCFASNRFLLPAWWVAIILLDVRAFATYASLPVGLLAGIAVSEALLPLLMRPCRPAPRRESVEWDDPPPAPSGRVLNTYAKPLFIFGCLLYYAAFAATVKEPGLGELVSLEALTPAEQEAMAWAGFYTPSDAAFLVVPNSPWETGKESEWFPVLAERRSVTTPQGYEWVGDNAFSYHIGAYYAAWGCASADADCLDYLASDWGLRFSYVYLPADSPATPCCFNLANSLDGDPRWQRVYDGPGGVIYERRFPG